MAKKTREFAVMRKFGERLRAERIAKGISQLELGLECDLSQTYLSQTEAGKRNISLTNMARLARALEVPLSSLVEGVESAESAESGDDEHDQDA